MFLQKNSGHSKLKRKTEHFVQYSQIQSLFFKSKNVKVLFSSLTVYYLVRLDKFFKSVYSSAVECRALPKVCTHNTKFCQQQRNSLDRPADFGWPLLRYSRGHKNTTKGPSCFYGGEHSHTSKQASATQLASRGRRERRDQK